MAATAPAQAEAEGGVFGLRDFRYFVIAQFIGAIAIQIQSVAVSWQIYDIAGNAMALGYVGLAQFLPIIALSLPAGNMADRFDRRRILVMAIGAQAIAAGFLLTLTLARPPDIWPFYAVLALFGAARAFGGPAQQAFLPTLVGEKMLPQAVAWSSSAFQTAVIAGPALGGVIYILGPSVAYATCLILMLLAACGIAMVRTRSEYRPPDAAIGALARLMAGIGYVRSKSVVLGAISLDLFAVLLGGATALLPIYAKDILHVGPSGLGVLRSAPALGAAVLGFTLGHVPLRRHAGNVMFVCVALFGISTIVFGLSVNFALSIIALVILGSSDMVSVYVRATLIQLATPDEMRGRVSGVNRIFIGASNELGAFESGLTATWFGTVPAVVLGGIGTLIVTVLWWKLFPALRRVDRLADVRPQ